MRDQLLDAIQTTRDFRVARELPWTSSGLPLYLKNLKTVYVSQPTVDVEPLVPILAGNGPQAETVSLTVFLATDAKRLPKTVDEQLKNIERLGQLGIEGVFRRTTETNTTYQTDVIINSYTFTYTRIKGDS